MKKVNALELRQSLSKIIELLQRTGEPILLERGRKPAAVIISLEDFQTRFVGKAADEKRRDIQKEILSSQKKSKIPEDSETILRAFRATH